MPNLIGRKEMGSAQCYREPDRINKLRVNGELLQRVEEGNDGLDAPDAPTYQ